jgi:hypothetical protein
MVFMSLLYYKLTIMKQLLPLVVLLLATTIANAQAKPKVLRKVLSLQMALTKDDNMPGTRGASVAWHPLQKKYYAAMAGNMGYPLGVFDAAGKRLSDDSLRCDADVRGMWYNPLKKQLQGNSYSDYGWFSYTLDAKGIPATTDIFVEGMNQPDEQSVGAFSLAKQGVLFIHDGYVSFYSIAGERSADSLKIRWGRTKTDGIGDDEETGTPEDYNNTTVVYTGLKGAELGFFNITEMQIELYDIASGFLSVKINLPEDAPSNASFNFAYANGMYWLFNIETRIWTGYK